MPEDDWISFAEVSGRYEIEEPREIVLATMSELWRPVVLTSVTTYVGLMPLMIESDLQARMLIPMAISLGYGVLFASAITLFLVPALYVVLHDVTSARSAGRERAEVATVPVAHSA